MWRGRLLEILGLGLIVTAFMHFTGSMTGWVDAVAGCSIALIGTSLWNRYPWPALWANLAGLIVLVAALIPSYHTPATNVWVVTIVGVITWIVGLRIVAQESGGPWRLKNRPVY